MNRPFFLLGYAVWLLRLVLYGVLDADTAGWLIEGLPEALHDE